MRYMMFIKHAENFRMEDVPQALFDEMGKFVDESMKNGSVIDTAGLRPTADGTRVQLSGGKITVTDGPFTEAKELIGGFAVFKVNSKQEAIAEAEKFMELHRQHWPGWEGETEVRQMFETGQAPAAR